MHSCAYHLINFSSHVLDNVQSTHLNPTDLNKLRPATSPVDIMPTRLFGDVIGVIGPSVLTILNSSLTSGVTRSYFKHAVIRPFRKKPNLNSSDLNHFQPISTIPFLSQVLEKISSFLTDHNDKFQSGFGAIAPKLPSLMTNYLLILLELTAAFDTMHHSILVL